MSVLTFSVSADFARDDVQALLDQAVADQRIPSAVAFLARDDEILWQVTSGEFSPGVPMRQDAIMPLASVGKMFTAVAAMILIERGDLHLNDLVSDLVPGFPSDAGITVHHLLTHTAGMTVDGSEFWDVWDKHVGVTTTTVFAADLANLPRTEPGTQFGYGQTGASYEVLGAVIENVSGSTLEAFMEDNIFNKLGLDDSSFYIPESQAYRLPTVFVRTEAGLDIFRKQGEDFSRSTFFHGGGGVRSSTADVHRFARMLLNKGTLDQVHILDSSTVDTMMTNQVAGKVPERWRQRGLGWGYGAAVTYKDGTLQQYGWVGGGFAKLFLDIPNRLIGFICFPLTPPGDNGLLHEFETLIYRQLDRGD